MIPYKKTVLEVASQLGSFSCGELYDTVLSRYPQACKAGVRGALYRLVRERKITKINGNRYVAKDRCPECGGEVNRENGEHVCTSCGLVLREHIATSSKLVWSEHAEPRSRYRCLRKSPFYRESPRKARLDTHNTLTERRFQSLHGVLLRRGIGDVYRARAEYLLSTLIRKTNLKVINEETLEALVDLVLLEKYPEKRLSLTADRRRRLKHLARLLKINVIKPLHYKELLNNLLSYIEPKHELYDTKRELYCGVNAALELLPEACAWALVSSQKKHLSEYGITIEEAVNNPEKLTDVPQLKFLKKKITSHRRFVSRSFFTAFCYGIAELTTLKTEEAVIQASKRLTPRAERALMHFLCFASKKPTPTQFHALRNLSPELAVVSEEVLRGNHAGERFLELMGNKDEYAIPCSAVGYEILRATGVSPSSAVWYVFKIRRAIELGKGHLYEAIEKALNAIRELRSL